MFTKAATIARSKEIATKDAKELRKTSVDLPVQAMSVKPVSKKFSANPVSRLVKGTCYWCGSKKHDPENCYYKDAKYFRCKQGGHISTVCHPPPTERKCRTIHEFRQELAGSREDDDELDVDCILVYKNP